MLRNAVCWEWAMMATSADTICEPPPPCHCHTAIRCCTATRCRTVTLLCVSCADRGALVIFVALGLTPKLVRLRVLQGVLFAALNQVAGIAGSCLLGLGLYVQHGWGWW